MNIILEDNQIDGLIISIVLILHGNGIKLFKAGNPEQKLEIVSIKSFERLSTQLHYK